MSKKRFGRFDSETQAKRKKAQQQLDALLTQTAAECAHINHNAENLLVEVTDSRGMVTNTTHRICTQCNSQFSLQAYDKQTVENAMFIATSIIEQMRMQLAITDFDNKNPSEEINKNITNLGVLSISLRRAGVNYVQGIARQNGHNHNKHQSVDTWGMPSILSR